MTNGCGWLSTDLVTFRNPAEELGHLIAMWHCATHNLKSARNAHMSSDTNGTREYITANGVMVGWDQIRAIYLRDQARVKNGSCPDTDLTLGAVIPDRYNKMNVKFNKAAYSYKTINEQFTYISGKLGCSREMMQKGTFDETKDFVNIYEQRMTILRIQWDRPDFPPELRSDYANLEFSVAVGKLYNEMLMFKERRITTDNLDMFEGVFIRVVTYFEKKEAVAARKSKDKLWEKRGLSAITYNNMRIGVCGFLQYARLVFTVENPPMYVPMLHSNTSSVESHFSMMRSHNADTPMLYQSKMGILDSSKSMMHLQNNKMYEVTKERGASMRIIDRTTGRSDSRRTTVFNGWLEVCDTSTIDTATSVLLLARDPNNSYNLQLTRHLQLFRSELEHASLQCSYSSLLVNEVPEFTSYAKASIGTVSEEWFCSFYSLSNNLIESNKFDVGCQRIMDRLLTFFEIIILSRRSSVKTSFWYNVMEYCHSLTFITDRQLFPIPMQGHTSCLILLQVLVTVFKGWIIKAGDNVFRSLQEKQLQDASPDEAQMSRENENREVNGIVGWGIKELLWQYREDAKGDEVDESVIAAVDFIEDMKIRHWEALGDEKYFNSCYAPSDAMRNLGGLTLVSPAYFTFGRQLLSAVRAAISQTTLAARKNRCMTEAESAIASNAALQVEFLKCNTTTTNISILAKKEIYKKLWKKVLHARAGVEFRQFLENNTSRYAANATNVTFRTELDASSKTTSVAKALSLEATIAKTALEN